MKMIKKLVITFFLFFVIISTIPYTSQGIIFHSSTKGHLLSTANAEYLLVYKDATISNDRIISNDLRARRCFDTPTEFQTIESNDSLITNYEIEYPLNYVPEDHDPTHLINKTAVVYFGDNVYVFMATEHLLNRNLTFFLSYSEDYGSTWSDLIWLHNTSALFSNLHWFDVSHSSTELILAYSYEKAPTFIDATTVLTINPTNLQITSSSDLFTPFFYGTDFEFFYDENENRLYCTMTDAARNQVKIVQINTIDFTFFTGSTHYLDPPHVINEVDVEVEEYHPSLTYWPSEEEFVVVAQDLIIDEYDVSQNITFEEFYIWGATIPTLGGTTQTYIKVVKDVVDGYYRVEPQITIYEDYLFVSFEVGEGHRFGGGWPEIAFGFSKDGEIWTDNFMGGFSIWNNLGVYFALATVGSFAIVLPSYYFISKTRKPK